MLKLHEVKMALALTQNNRFAGTTQEPSHSRESYYCPHYSEPVTPHKTPAESWFTIHSPRRQNIIHWSSVSSRA